MIFTKVTHVSAQFQIFDCSGEISPNLYFDSLLWLKVDKISAKQVQRSYVSWYWRVMQNLKKNLFVVSKTTRIWWILIRAFKSLKNLHFDWSLLSKVITFDLKKYRVVFFHDAEKAHKIWRKTDFDLFFSSEHLKVSKLVLSQDSFVQSRKCMS